MLNVKGIANFAILAPPFIPRTYISCSSKIDQTEGALICSKICSKKFKNMKKVENGTCPII